jgi:sugar lactone lactonase YvrE
MALSLDQVNTHGSNLCRPECVLTHRSGLTFVSDWTDSGGVTIIKPDGQINRVLAQHHFPLRPNGICLEPGGSFLIAHLGDNRGGVYRLSSEGRVETFLDRVDGELLPPSNFVLRDCLGRTWITVSTRSQPRADAYRSDVSSGFIILCDQDGARIVADGLGYTNECALSPDSRTLYVNETFARRLSAFDVKANGELSERRTIVNFGEGIFPDGLCLAEDGSLWVTSIVSNRLIRVDSHGKPEIVIEDFDPEWLREVEAAYLAGTMGRPHLNIVHSKLLRNISSLAFGGDNLHEGFLGCLLGNSIYRIPMPVRGVAPVHWDFTLGELEITGN